MEVGEVGGILYLDTPKILYLDRIGLFRKKGPLIRAILDNEKRPVTRKCLSVRPSIRPSVYLSSELYLKPLAIFCFAMFASSLLLMNHASEALLFFNEFNEFFLVFRPRVDL